MSLFGETDEGAAGADAASVPYDWVRKYRYNFSDQHAEYVLMHDRDRVRYVPLPLKAHLSKVCSTHTHSRKTRSRRLLPCACVVFSGDYIRAHTYLHACIVPHTFTLTSLI